VIRVAIAVFVAVAVTLLVGYYTRLGAVIWTVRPGNGLHDADLAAGLLAGGLTWLLIRPR
jgi:hypothetical protein